MATKLEIHNQGTAEIVKILDKLGINTYETEIRRKVYSINSRKTGDAAKVKIAVVSGKKTNVSLAKLTELDADVLLYYVLKSNSFYIISAQEAAENTWEDGDENNWITMTNLAVAKNRDQWIPNITEKLFN